MQMLMVVKKRIYSKALSIAPRVRLEALGDVERRRTKEVKRRWTERNAENEKHFALLFAFSYS